MKEKIIAFFISLFINFFIMVYALYSEDNSLFIANDILVSPIGWENQQEIEHTLKILNIDIFNSFTINDNNCIIYAPIGGKVRQSEGRLILENDVYKIVYPELVTSIVSDQAYVNFGEQIASLNEYEDNSLIVFLRNIQSTVPYINFQNGSFRIKVKKTEKIFAISSGKVFLFPTPLCNMYSISIIDCIYSLYLGVGELLVNENTLIQKGEQIGISGNGLNNNFFELQLITGLGPLSPQIIYVEVHQDRQCF